VVLVDLVHLSLGSAELEATLGPPPPAQVSSPEWQEREVLLTCSWIQEVKGLLAISSLLTS